MDEDVKIYIRRAKQKDLFTVEELLDWLGKIYKLLDYINDQDRYNTALAGICHVADMRNEDPMVQCFLNEVIIKSRIFLYRDMLKEPFLRTNELSLTSEFVKSFYTDNETGTVLTKHQKEILGLFLTKRRLVISAPTSFGKTKILEEIILNSSYANIAIIVPTNALLTENYHRFKDNEKITKRYNLFFSSRFSEMALSGNNIFILTPEKLLNLLDEIGNDNFCFDFFALDEFYKISKNFDSSDDEAGKGDKRYKVFQYVLYRLAKNKKTDFYLIGPYINEFTKNFLEKENAEFKEYKTEIVQKEIYKDKVEYQNLLGVKIIKDKSENLKRILLSVNKNDEKSLVYVSNIETAERLAIKFVECVKFNKVLSKSESDELESFISYIEKNISNEWFLVNCLRKGIGVHHGSIPRYIQTEIIDLFNHGNIHTLFCTTTLAEGVNTAAKNVIFYDSKKSRYSLSTFDRKNIEGRAGRFNMHFIGNVFYLEEVGCIEEKTVVGYEFYDSDDLPKEDILLIDDADLREKSSKKKEQMLEDLKNANISNELLKANRFISIERQVLLVKYLRDIDRLPFGKDTSFFEKESFDELMILTFKLAETEIKNDKERWNSYTAKQLSWISCSYMHDPAFNTILGHDVMNKSKNIDTKIRGSLKLLNNHFEFLLPKYLKALQEIYNFVAIERDSEKIDLGLCINLLEFGLSEDSEIILRDSGLPLEVIKKIKHYFNKCSNVEDVKRVKSEKIREIKGDITKFEAKLLDRYL